MHLILYGAWATLISGIEVARESCTAGAPPFRHPCRRHSPLKLGSGGVFAAGRN